MLTRFIHLNPDWNAEPNAPDEQVRVTGTTVFLSFDLNAYAYPGVEDGDRAEIAFERCARYRLGSTNDEGWFRGQCRFSNLAPAWGEFYEIEGDPLLQSAPDDWIEIDSNQNAEHHYVFFLRDSTFECRAAAFTFRRLEK
jgi:hypothetical protein